MGYLLGFIPTFRGLITLGVAGAIGGWLGGESGAGIALIVVTALAFLKPNISMWLESVLFSVRGVCYVLAAFRALLAFGPIKPGPHMLEQAIFFGAIGVVAHIRIWWLVRKGELCPMAMGTTKMA